MSAVAAWRARAMRRADLPAVMAIERASYQFPWSEGVFRDCLRVGYGCWVALDDEDRVAGYGLMSTAVDEAHVLNLCVSPACRRRGLGTFLLTHLICEAARARMVRILLEVRPSNAEALGLYRAQGFSPVGRRKRYYPAHDGREDAIVLARRL